MTPSDPALRLLSADIKETVELRNLSRLAELLRGRRLPAVGDDLSPADVLLRALWQLEDLEIARRLSPLVAELIDRSIGAGQEDGALEAGQKTALVNAMRLARDLPADTRLSSVLRRLLIQLEARLGRAQMESSDFGLSVWHAMVYQQMDQSCEEEWLAILWGLDRDGTQWTSGHRTLLLIAWRGLLWIPPAPDLRDGEILDFTRIERGLVALSDAVAGHEEESTFLRQALDILTDTFPRSPNYWQEHLGARQDAWPPALKRQAAQKWPDLKQPDLAVASLIQEAWRGRSRRAYF